MKKKSGLRFKQFLLLISTPILLLASAKDTFAVYNGDLSQKFKETEVFRFDTTQKMYGYFTADHRNITVSTTLPSSAVLSNSSLTINQKTGIIIANSQSGNSFYKIEVTIVDSSQTALTAFITLLDNLWSYSLPSKGSSAGIDTTNSSSTYWYDHTQFKKVGEPGWDGTPITQAQYDFSRRALSKFVRRRSGEIKIEIYVTPSGIYPVIDGANFNSFPDLYTGSYLSSLYPVNYIVLAKWDAGGQAVVFKDLKIIDLDETISGIDEVNAHFLKKRVKSQAFRDLLSNPSLLQSKSGFQDALWAAFALRGYDYYFKTYNVPKVRELFDYYLAYLPTHITEGVNRYGIEATRSINITFVNGIQANAYIVWALSGYLTSSQLETARVQFARAIDKIMEYTRPFDANPGLQFPNKINYNDDTFAEETGWPLAFLTGYYLNFPNDQPRAEKVLDYIKFYGFHHFTTSIDESGESLETEYFDGLNKGEFLGQKLRAYNSSTQNFLNTWTDYSTRYQKSKLTYVKDANNGPHGPDDYMQFSSKYIWPDGFFDNHGFHPSLGYASGEIHQAAIARNALAKKGLVVATLSHNLEMVYQSSVKKYSNLLRLRFNRYIPKWGCNGRTALELCEDYYLFDPSGFIVEFEGRSMPSHLDDWAGMPFTWATLENYGDYPASQETALNTYFGYFPGSGHLFCGYNLTNGQYCQTTDFYYGSSLYAMLFSARSGYDPQEIAQVRTCSFSTRTYHYDAAQASNNEFITRNSNYYKRLDQTGWTKGDLASDPDVIRYRENAQSPCFNRNPGQCIFTTRSVHYDKDNKLVEAITLGPSYYVWTEGTGWWNVPNHDLALEPRYRENAHAPCFNKNPGECVFTTRFVYQERGTNRIIEWITIGSSIFKWSSDLGWEAMSDHDLATDSFYKPNQYAPCFGKDRGTCKFDTDLRFYDKSGVLIESVTVGDRFFAYTFNTGWWLVADNRLGVVPRYNEPDGPCQP